jgi:hypothetical protein
VKTAEKNFNCPLHQTDFVLEKKGVHGRAPLLFLLASKEIVRLLCVS